MTFTDLSPLANHLWQSTLFAAVAWLLTLALRKNRAAVRYGLWMAASVKFLIPFSLLVSAGAQLPWRTAPALGQSQFAFAMDEISQPFAAPAPTHLPAVAAPAPNSLPAILFAVWLCGIAIGIVFWMRWWWQIRSLQRVATPFDLNLPVRVMSSPTRLEPGVFGIRKPFLLLPEGIADRLTPPQLEAIVAHELRHVQRRDNLTAAIHMLVETIFWFHPLVWWIRARLMEERERACDEGVLRMGSEPQVYAESILKVCEFYLASPVACAAGVTGGELKKRIEGIMANRFMHKLSLGKRVVLASTAIIAIAGPITIGLVTAPRGRAQSSATAPQSFEVASVKLASTSNGPPDGFSFSPNRSGGGIHWITDRRSIFFYAFRLPAWRISGIESDDPFYAIDAKTDASASDDQVRLMFQTLLVERFHLAARRETRDANGYAMVVAANGPKIKPVKPGDPIAPLPEYFRGKTGMEALIEGKTMLSAERVGAALTGRRVSMSQLAEALQEPLRTAVLDRTGLSGNYYFSLVYARDNDPESNAPTLFTAMQEELGLRLEKQRVPVEFLVVDHIEKKPTEN